MELLHALLMMSPEGGDQNPLMSFLPIILIIVVFYFFMIRPQAKRAKEVKKFRESLNKGDKVVTTGGIHGKIVEMNDRTAILEIEGGNRLKVERSAISAEMTQGGQGGGLGERK